MAKKIIFAALLLTLLPAVALATVSEGWERHVIGDQTSPIYLYVADMDGDGNLDVVTTTNVHPGIYDSEVAWYQNNLKVGGEWKKFIISSNAPGSDVITNANGVVVADIDNDGRPDVVVGTGQAGTVYWFKAPANPEQENWQRFQVEPSTDEAFYKMYTMDVNNDGKQDIIAGTKQGTYVYRNPGTPAEDAAQWQKTLIAAGTGYSNYLADMDCDGKMDIINSHMGSKEDGYKGNISWVDVVYTKGVVSFNRTMIDDNLFKSFDVNTMDVNSDRRTDVLVSIFQTPGLYWYEAPAKTSDPWAKHTISDTFEGTDLYTGDINGDGRKEMIISGLFTNKISWFEPTADDTLWTEHVLDDEILLPGDISLNDMDGDGDLDVVLAGMGENQIIWYENKTPQQNTCVFTYLFGKNSAALPKLRDVRDAYLKSTSAGQLIIKAYYTCSPGIVKLLQSLQGSADWF